MFCNFPSIQCFLEFQNDNFQKEKDFFLKQKFEPEWKLVLRENPKISSNVAAYETFIGSNMLVISFATKKQLTSVNQHFRLK